MARLKRRLLITAVVAVLYADFLAVMRWRTRKIDYFICGGPGDVCNPTYIKRRDARPSDWATLAAYTAGNVAFGLGLFWLRVRRRDRRKT